MRLNGEDHRETLREAGNYARSLTEFERFEEAKSLMRKTMPVARRVLGDNNDDVLRMRGIYAQTLFEDPAATLDDLREAVTTLEDMEPIARRLLGNSHPTVRATEFGLRQTRAALRARETPGGA